MAEIRKIQVPWMGRMVNGMDIPVDESTEKWSEVKLVDGTVIRVKQTVASVVRLENEWDQEGNPIYVVKSAPAIAIIHVDETLRKGAIKN
jgi:hypothetical protein